MDFSSALAARAEEVASGLEARPGGPAGWRPLRLLFRNFWLFEREEFRFVHGRLFLRGANASGKSTVLAAAVPLVLDGHRARHRLDTFGGGGRSLQYFLVGPDTADRDDPEAFYHEQRTGYVALEFARQAPADGGPRHLTIGIGLHCSRHRDGIPVTFWGFCIHDGRRIGHDLELVGPDSVSLRRQELEQALGAGGTVVSAEGAYRDLVNGALFGFEDPEDFAHLLRLLLELRAPKLNRDMGPRVVGELLAESLPPVDRSLFDQLRAILEQIDDHADRCGELRRRHEAVERLDDAVALVQARRAEGRSARYVEALGLWRKARAEAEAALERRQEAQAALDAAAERSREAEGRALEVEGQLQALRESEVLQAEDALAATEARVARAEERVRARQGRVDALGSRLGASERERDLARDLWAARAEAVRRCAEGYVRAAEAAGWPLALDAARTAIREMEPAWSGGGGSGVDAAAAVRAAWLRQVAAERERALGALRGAMLEQERAEARQRTAQARFDVAHDHTRAAREEQALRDNALAEAGAEAAAAVRGWWEDLSALRIGAPAVQAAGQWLRGYRDPRLGVAAGLQPLRQAVAAHRRAAEAERRELQRAHDEAAARLADKEDELRAWEAQTEAVPPRSDAVLAARALLADEGLPATPLYEACDLDPALPVDAAARIEAAVEQAGLLDALVLAPEDRARAEACLAAQGRGDVFVLDPDAARSALAAAGGPVDAGAGESDAAVLHPDGSWRHGLLGGRAPTPAPGSAPRYFGADNRRRRHRERLEQLRGERDMAADALGLADSRLQASLAAADTAEEEAEALARLPALTTLADAAVSAADAAGRAERARRAEEEELAAVQEAGRQLAAALQALEQAQAPLPETRGRTAAGLEELVVRLRAAVDACRDTAAAAQSLNDAAAALRAARAAAETVRGDIESEARELREEQADLGREQAAARELRALLDSAEGRRVRDRHRALREEEAHWRQRARAAAEDAARLAERAANAGERSQAAQAAVDAAAGPEAEERSALEVQLAAYPTLARHLEALRSGPGGAEDVARALLSRRRGDDLQTGRIAADLNRARAEFVRVEFEGRALLADYAPERSDELDLVRFRAAGPSIWPSQLREELRARLLRQEELLRASERQLYEDFLLHQMRESLHTRIRATEQWTEHINEDLRAAPLGSGEILELRWAPVPGAGVAAHLPLLRTDPAVLRPEQRQVLADAFRAEVERIRREDQEQSSDLGFGEALEEALDYRRWFRFEIVSRSPHQRAVLIDDRRFSTRSGAEKSLALVLPLVAAAAARYDHALPDAPRIIAFDEAFAGVDPRNVAESLRFLRRFDFSWVMASERLWGVGSALPAAATYELMRRGNTVAALPFLWDGARLVDVAASALGGEGGGP